MRLLKFKTAKDEAKAYLLHGIIFAFIFTGIGNCTSNIVKKIQAHQMIISNIHSGLAQYNKQWSNTTINRTTNILELGQKIFNIDYRNVLGIIAIESEFNIKAYNINKHENHFSFDYGLTQINSQNWKWLSRQSHKILKKHNIKHNPNDTYDNATNIMNCFVYLNNARKQLQTKRKFTKAKWIMSYNVGVMGSILNYKIYIKRRKHYYKKFKIAKQIFS